MTGYSDFLDALDHPRTSDIRDLVSRIHLAFPTLGREIKWNGPSFTAGGVNIATFRLFPPPQLQLILHCGSKRLPEGTDLTFALERLGHKWADETRCIIEVPTGEDMDHCVDAVASWRSVLEDRGLIQG
jgi:hypothetical protein